MIPILALIVSLRSADDAFGPKTYPPVYIPAEAPNGYLYRPAIDLRGVPRPPATTYAPQPGDVLLMSDPEPPFTLLFRIARSGRPGHCGEWHFLRPQVEAANRPVVEGLLALRMGLLTSLSSKEAFDARF